VEQAVLVLGHRPILRIVFAIAFNSTMSAPLHTYAAEANELWRHSLVVALACETLAESGLALQAEPSVAFTAGLLHDIGKVALNPVIGEEAQTAIRTRIKEGGKSSVEAEMEVLGTDHAHVGSCLLQSWKLPEEIVEAVGNHHHPLCKPKPRLSALVNAADVLAYRTGPQLNWESLAAALDPNVIGALELTPEKFKELLTPLNRSLAQVDHLSKMS
jgi:putative nucleotidyltransferase with HDIG domain